MRSALAVLGEATTGRRVAVLGEMRELGDASAAAHREVGRVAAERGVSFLILVGAKAEEMRAGAVEAGMDASAVAVVASHAEAARRVRDYVQPGDVVLIKGSRGARMEQVLAHLREEA
jgi:UDP-N-acetylmuramoyl-tripeptide--D-alanyl-D-alanine ligase